ncbi:copper ion binding protein [Evansella vedderi]|uniref:Copper chaperone CopZ n=1 Tax=Evansella vedderi TaxID=38282 RepID=A0ABT9ZWQ5_9BACI|nr:cation transporter [Evansella vedderi]MDQ0255663.1 copper ion binding protein [Evansella vedderi]
MKEVTLTVKGMTCGGCVQTVEKALANLPGVERALADFENAIVKVEFDEESTSVEQLKNTIQRAGYQTQK